MLKKLNINLIIFCGLFAYSFSYSQLVLANEVSQSLDYSTIEGPVCKGVYSEKVTGEPCLYANKEQFRLGERRQEKLKLQSRYKPLFSKKMTEYLFAPDYPKATISGFLNFFQIWSKRPDRVYGGKAVIITFINDPYIPENHALFSLIPVWKFTSEKNIFSKLSHPSNSVLVDLKSLPKNYAEKCYSKLFDQRIIPIPESLPEILIELSNGEDFRALIEEGASEEHLLEFLTRCKFTFRGRFQKLESTEKITFYVEEVLDFNRKKTFLENVWSKLEPEN